MITVFIGTVVWYDPVNTRRGLTSMFLLAHSLRRWTDMQPLVQRPLMGSPSAT